MRRKHTFAQIEMAKMRVKRRKRLAEEARHRRELRMERERAEDEIRRAISTVNAPLMKKILEDLDQQMTKDVARIVVEVMSSLEIELDERPTTAGMITNVCMRIPPLNLGQAVPSRDLKSQRARVPQLQHTRF